MPWLWFMFGYGALIRQGMVIGVDIEVLVQMLSFFSDGRSGVNSSILSHYSYISTISNFNL